MSAQKFKSGMIVKIEGVLVELVKKLSDVPGGWFTTPGPEGFRYWNELDMTPTRRHKAAPK